MAAMDRLPEAADLLRRCDAAAPAEGLATASMQRDYLWAFLALSRFSLRPPDSTAAAAECAAHRDGQRAQLASVQAAVDRHVKAGAGRWATMWAEMASYVTELIALCDDQGDAGGGEEHAYGADMHDAHAQSAGDAFLALDTTETARGRMVVSTPGAAGSARGSTAAARGEHDEWLEVAFREVDVESAFSSCPFDGLQGSGGVRVVQPAWRARVPVEATGTTELDLFDLAPGVYAALRAGLAPQLVCPLASSACTAAAA